MIEVGLGHMGSTSSTRCNFAAGGLCKLSWLCSLGSEDVVVLITFGVSWKALAKVNGESVPRNCSDEVSVGLKQNKESFS